MDAHRGDRLAAKRCIQPVATSLTSTTITSAVATVEASSHSGEILFPRKRFWASTCAVSGNNRRYPGACQWKREPPPEVTKATSVKRTIVGPPVQHRNQDRASRGPLARAAAKIWTIGIHIQGPMARNWPPRLSIRPWRYKPRD